MQPEERLDDGEASMMPAAPPSIPSTAVPLAAEDPGSSSEDDTPLVKRLRKQPSTLEQEQKPRSEGAILSGIARAEQPPGSCDATGDAAADDDEVVEVKVEPKPKIVIDLDDEQDRYEARRPAKALCIPRVRRESPQLGGATQMPALQSPSGGEKSASSSAAVVNSRAFSRKSEDATHASALQSTSRGEKGESSSAAHASNPPLPSLSSAENVTWDGSLPVDEYYSSNFAIFKHRQQPHVQSAPPPPPPPPPTTTMPAQHPTWQESQAAYVGRNWMRVQNAQAIERQRHVDRQRAMMEADLPPQWVVMTSRSTGRLYFFNRNTDQTTYDKPRPVACLYDGKLKIEVYTPPQAAPSGEDDDDSATTAPPWADKPHADNEIPDEIESAGADSGDVCSFFGSEAGCFQALRNGFCDRVHRNPNSVPKCRDGDSRCLRKGACSRRHRKWTSWQDCEAFYCRLGPYTPAQPQEDDDLTEKYARHLAEYGRAKQLFDSVCGAVDDFAELANSETAMFERCPRGFCMLLRRGWQYGHGLGRWRNGVIEPIPHKNACFISARSHHYPSLGLGHELPSGAYEGFTPSLIDVEPGPLAEAARRFAPKWVPGGVMASEGRKGA